jgi:arylsulfatase A-like enzyme
VWIVVADHGEQFMERGRFGHGRDLYDELIRVPLAVFGDLGDPLQGGVVEQAVETALISRTLAELAGSSRSRPAARAAMRAGPAAASSAS